MDTKYEDAGYPKEDPQVLAAEADDADVQQVAGRNYDPAFDKRDMRRLGKRQELKVGHWATMY